MYTNSQLPTNLSPLQGLRVLVVDNNVDCCDLMVFLLQPYGIDVQTAFSAQQALQIFRQWQPDVLVSDIALPKQDGYALIKQVRTKVGKRGQVVLAIAVTGYINENMLQRALVAGFDLWFPKPLNFDEFLAVLVCLAVCQQSSYAIAQRILNPVPRHRNFSIEKQGYYQRVKI